MSGRVYIHIGAPKTGTTYLQQVLGTNRESLKAAGVLYPHVAGDAHHTSIRDLRDSEKGKAHPRAGGDWAEVARLSAAWSGAVSVLSSELFVYATTPAAARALTSFYDAEVHVIYTARDLGRQVPAVWQERLKNSHSMGYTDYIEDVLGPTNSRLAQGFWTAQDAAKALQRWSQGIDPSQVHVVTAPPAGAPPVVLWERFASVLGLEGRDFSSAVPAVNTSLSVTAAELLRRFNERHAEGMSRKRHRHLVKNGLANLLTEVVPDASKLPLSESQQERIAQRAEQLTLELSAAGYDIVGSLDDLRPAVRAAGSGNGPDDLSDSEVIDGLLDVIKELLPLKVRHDSR
ncbi:MAG: hypothetical protein M3423_04130 [Actinomycetota bacterium]|nr:hypothetical protein [Actinomycetota bacterium]